MNQQIKSIPELHAYVALLRGINVGGHHKVPMSELSRFMTALGFSHIKTLLNSGNVVFHGPFTPTGELEHLLSEALKVHFGFAIPVLIRTSHELLDILMLEPFEQIKMHKDLRLYVSFLKQEPLAKPTLPLFSDDNSYTILAVEQKSVFSVLDVSQSKTVKGMADLEQLFGKEITTRNWNTVIKIGDSLKLR